MRPRATVLTQQPQTGVTVTTVTATALARVLHAQAYIDRTAKPNKQLQTADAVTPADATSTSVIKTVADSVTPADATASAVTMNTADSVTPADATGNTVIKTVADSVTTADSNTVGGGIQRADSVTPADSASALFTTAAWDAGHASPIVTVSGGGRIATANSGVTGGGITSYNVNGSGLWCGTFAPQSGAAKVGLSTTNVSITANPGSSNASCVYAQDGTVTINNAVVATIATWANGNTIDMAWDASHKMIWFRVNGGNWNNSGTANPATNTGGISLSTMSTGPFFCMYAGWASPAGTSQVNLQNTASLPSGFSQW